MSDRDKKKSSDESNEDPFSDLLGDELGEWDKMFDSLHETNAPVPDEFIEPSGEVAASDDGELEITIGLPETLDEPLPDFGAPADERMFEDFLVEPPPEVFTETAEKQLDVDVLTSAISTVVPAAIPTVIPTAIAEDPQLESLAIQGGITDDDLGFLSETPESFFEDEVGIPMPTASNFELDDDFYDGIEIDNGPDEVEVRATPARGVAHVVRRLPQPAVQEVSDDSGLKHREITAIRSNPLSAEEAFTVKTAVGPAKVQTHTLELEDEAEDNAPKQGLATASVKEEMPIPSEAILTPISNFSDDFSLDLDDEDETAENEVGADDPVIESPPVIEDEPVVQNVPVIEDEPAIDGDLTFDEDLPLDDGEDDLGFLPEAVFSLSLPETIEPDKLALAAEVGPDESDRSADALAYLQLCQTEIDSQGDSTLGFCREAGRVAESLEMHEEALAFWDEVLSEDSGTSDAIRTTRRIERSLQQWEMADERLSAEIDQASGTLKLALQSYRCDLLMALGNHELAREACKAVLSEKPSDTRSLLQNLELAILSGAPDTALHAAEALADTFADLDLSSAAHALAGTIRTQAPNETSSERQPWKHFQLSMSKTTSCSVGALLTGLGVWRLHDSESATEALERILDDEILLVSRVKSEGIRSALHWQLAQRMEAAGRLKEAQLSMVRAEAYNTQGGQLALWLALWCTRGPKANASSWTNLAEITNTPIWQSHAYYRASCFSGKESALQSLTSASQLLPSNTFLAAELRRCELDNGNAEFVYARDLSTAKLCKSGHPRRPLALVRLLESAAATSVRDEAEQLLRVGIESGEVGTALRCIGIHAVYRSADQQALVKYHQAATESASNLSEGQASGRSACRSLSRAVLADSDSANADLVAEAWAELAREYESAEAQQGAWHLAIFNARIAGDLPKAAEYASEGASLCRDNTLKFQLFLSAHIDCPPSPDEVQSEFSDVNDTGVRSAEYRWSAALIATDWTVAAEALESLAESSADLGVRDRSLYRAAFIRLNKGAGSDVAEQSLSVIRTRHEEFCDLLQKSPSISKVSRGRAPVLRQEDSDLSVEIRRADVLVGEGDSQAAVNLLEQLAQQYPSDALVKYEFERACWLAKASAQLSAALMGQLRVAEKASDMPAKAALCDKLARVDFELRDDAESAMMFWETAANADPLNLGYQRTLEREYLGAVGKEPRWAKMLQVLGRIAEQTPDANEKSYYYGQQALLAQISGQGESVTPALRSALAANPVCRPALFSLESSLRRAPATTELAEVESSVASYFKKDSLARAAFLVRSGKTWLELDDPAHALRKFQGAVSSVAGFRPAFHAWRKMALDRELWGDLAAVFAAESQAASGEQKIHLCHLVGVVFMDKDDNPDEAKSAFRRVLTLAPQHRDAFVRLRLLLTEDEEFAELAALAESRIESVSADMASDRVAEKCELHHLVATLNTSTLADDETALAHFRAILEHRPNDRDAVSGVADLTLKLELWSDAASALMLRVRMETDSDELKTMYHQLGTIYSEHLPEVKWALRSYERVIAIDPGDSVALRAISKLGMESGDYQIALGACEKLIAQNPDRAEKIATLHRIARIFVDGFQNVTQAERALRAALDVDPSSEIARSTIVSFFMGRNDPRSARLHIDTVVRAMHNRLMKTHKDAEAYRTLVHSLEARAKCGSTESESVAISAARVSVLLGESDSEIVRIAQRPALPAARSLASGAHDDMLWAGSRKAALRSIFRLVGDKLSKTVGIDLKSLGVGRSDRLRKGGDLSVAVVAELCETMGAEVPDLYVARDRSTTLGMVPGRPAALVLGKELISIKRPDELRFLVGRSMILARAGLAAPLGLGKADFGALLVALLRYFVNDFSPEGIDEKRAVDFHHRLRKLMSPAVMLELQPYAMGLTGSDFNHNSIWQETHEVANRAGLLCTGNIGAAVEVLMRTNKQDTIEDAMQDPEISSLVRFSTSLDYGAYWAAISATES